MKKDPVIAELTQHPVGHGGFFFGTVRCGKREFRWVYDCGSIGRNSKDLKREIDKVSKHRKIDALYLSHLHSDHFNGIDYLLNKCDVKQLVIPYLNGYKKVYSLLYNFELLVSGDVSEQGYNIAKELILNPEEFCSKRKIEKLIKVMEKRIESEDEDEEDADEESSEAEEEDLVYRWHPSPKRESSPDDSSESTVEVYTVQGGAVASVSIKSHFLNWEFVPHFHPMLLEKEAEFRDMVNEIIKKKDIDHKLSDKEVNEIADSQSKLQDLRKCFDAVASNLNPLSMSLYVGPKFAALNNPYVCIKGEVSIRYYSNICKFIDLRCCPICHVVRDLNRRHYWTQRLHGGWILTGDSDFTITDHLNCFKNRYRKFEPYIDVVMVPHHGSIGNVNQDFFDFFNNPVVTYVTAKPGNKHPNPLVQEMANELAPFHVVSKDSASGLTLRSRWWVCS